MSTKEQYWKYSLIAIIIGLGIILFRQIAPFMGGLLGALTIYILVRKQMMYLSDKRKMKRSIAATLITAEAILCFLVPLGLVVWLAVVNLQNINLDPQAIIAPFEEAANIIKAKTGYYILGKDTVAYVISILPRIGQAIMGGISVCEKRTVFVKIVPVVVHMDPSGLHIAAGIKEIPLFVDQFPSIFRIVVIIVIVFRVVKIIVVDLVPPAFSVVAPLVGRSSQRKSHGHRHCCG